MTGISKIEPAIKIVTPKIGIASYVNKPNVVSVLREDIGKIRYASDSFHSTKYKPIKPEEIRSLFVDGKIDGGDLRKEMYQIKMILFFKSFLKIKNFKLWLHSVNLSSKLSSTDCKEIADFINLFEGKYANIWKGYSSTDMIPNIEKLALFVRSIKRIEKLDFYKNLDQKTWETCMDGIINKPKEVIRPLMEYKFDSRDINNAISAEKGSSKIVNFIKSIENFLKNQFIRHDVQVYRGEGDFGIFDSVVIDPKRNLTLKSVLEEFTERIDKGLCSDEEIKEFIEQNLRKKYVPQNRFMSTAIEPSAIERFAKKVYWEIFVPAKSKASFIESYNVERESEAEILIQRMSQLSIKEAEYIPEKGRWNIKAELVQDNIEKSML